MSGSRIGIHRALSLSLFLGVLLAACGGSYSSGPAKTTIVFGGVFAGENGTEAGRLIANIVVEDSSGAGSFVVNGSGKNFSSISYDGTSIVATGQGFVFTGTADDSTISGTYTSPSGGGLFTGLKKIGGATPTAYCGTHIGAHNGTPIAGPFTFVERSGTRVGVFTSVLGDSFRGLLHAANSAGPVTLDTLNGAAAVTVAGANFTGSYLMTGGDSGAIAGTTCPSTIPGSIASGITGVLGSYDGNELGDFSFSLQSSGLGSTGSYTIGGVVKNFLAVVSGVNNQVAGFDSTFRVVATMATDTMEGTYTNPGTGAIGKIGGLDLHGGTAEPWCGVQSGGGLGNGAFSFLLKPDSTIFGLYTGGSKADSFQGQITGKAGNDSSSMEGLAAPVTVLPSVSGFSGVFFLPGGGSGSVTGGKCP
jgi:hypothetical protein